MNDDRPLAGIALMLVFCILAPLADAIAKLLGASVSLLLLLTVRFGIQMVVLLPVVWIAGRVIRPQPGILGIAVLRTLLHILGVGLMFLSLRYLPLADAVAIAFVMPFILLAMGHFLLGEEVGRRRIVASGIGFIGTLFVIQPSFADVGWPALLPLGAAFVFAAFILSTRFVARRIDAIPLQAASGIIASAILIPVLIAAYAIGWPGLETRLPATGDLWLLLGLGLLGTTAHLVMTWSLRFAPASTLAPMQYLEIPIAAFLGLLIFRDFPNGFALVGIAITISAGLYVVFRERALSRAPGPRLPRQAPPAV